MYGDAVFVRQRFAVQESAREAAGRLSKHGHDYRGMSAFCGFEGLDVILHEQLSVVRKQNVKIRVIEYEKQEAVYEMV